MTQPIVAVRYIYPRPGKGDGLHGSGLTFALGQVRSVPAHVAKMLLRHRDLFEREDDAIPAPEPAPEPADDTAEQMAKAQRQKTEKDLKERDRMDLMDQIDRMDDVALGRFAKDKFGVNLDRRRKLESLRDEVRGFIDRFGAV